MKNIAVMQTILNKIKENNKIFIFRHFRPDGDATGSTKGLAAILKLTFPEKKIYLQNADFSDYLAFLGSEDELLPDEEYADALGIVLDTATASRISNKSSSRYFSNILNPPIFNQIIIVRLRSTCPLWPTAKVGP